MSAWRENVKQVSDAAKEVELQNVRRAQAEHEGREFSEPEITIPNSIDFPAGPTQNDNASALTATWTTAKENHKITMPDSELSSREKNLRRLGLRAKAANAEESAKTGLFTNDILIVITNANMAKSAQETHFNGLGKTWETDMLPNLGSCL